VEINDYCQRIIQQRIKDGYLPEAPIFGDINLFISEGYAEAYKGLVDVIAAGFPCQPFSVAGKRKGKDDSRNMWLATIRTIRIIQPKFCLLENVSGLLNHEYIRTIFRDLAESGYQCRWRILSAAEVGAPHKRDRSWVVAYSTSQRQYKAEINKERQITRQGWWNTEPALDRVAHGVAHRVDRLKALGNGQVPAVVKAVWELLNGTEANAKAEENNS
jgi:DNA (cytosine-5)-methyltransferase 1